MSAFKDLLLATNNSKKLKEIQEILGNQYSGKLFRAADFPDYPEPEETGKTYAENAKIKATYYANHTGIITLADDSGLCVDALDGRPGVYSARYETTDNRRIDKLLKELGGVSEDQRTARFVCAMCVVVPGGKNLEVEGTLEGRIAFTPRGEQGFGYDPIFLVHNSDKTLAQLSADEKNSISHRANAMKKVLPRLLEALTGKN